MLQQQTELFVRPHGLRPYQAFPSRSRALRVPHMTRPNRSLLNHETCGRERSSDFPRRPETRFVRSFAPDTGDFRTTTATDESTPGVLRSSVETAPSRGHFREGTFARALSRGHFRDGMRFDPSRSQERAGVVASAVRAWLGTYGRPSRASAPVPAWPPKLPNYGSLRDLKALRQCNGAAAEGRDVCAAEHAGDALTDRGAGEGRGDSDGFYGAVG